MVTSQRQFTVYDLENFPDDGSRYEVIDGELYVTAAPHFEHQFALLRVTIPLGIWCESTGRGALVDGAGLIFDLNSGVIPDLLWVSSERLPAITVNPRTGQRDGKFHAAPELVVEVLSPGRENEERDRETKLTLYSRRGVREYWIVDRFTRQVEVYRRTPAAVLELAVILTAADTITSPLLPEFALPVEQIFRLPPGLDS
jgi:Uma2 family endonuclease